MSLATLLSNIYLKYSKYTRLGYLYINLLQQSLDKTYKEYKKKVADNKALLAKVIAYLMQNKKILQQAKDQATKKLFYLALDLRVSSKSVDIEVDNINCLALDALVRFLLMLQSTLGNLEALTSITGLGSNPTF